MFYVVYFPYYDTSLFITPTWDGATVNRIVLNDIYAKQNVGVPVKIWNGSTWTDSTYKDAQRFVEKLHWIVEFDEIPDGLRPFGKCVCESFLKDCHTGSCYTSYCGFCGFKVFVGCLGGCAGSIVFQIDL
jgi:hypothetical protein